MDSSSFFTPLLAATDVVVRKSPHVTFIWGAVLIFLLFYYLGTAEQRRKKVVGALLTGLMIFFCLWAIDGWNAFTGKPINIKLGMDLAGGSEFTVQLKPGTDEQGQPKEVSPDAVQQAIGIIEKRLNPEGVKDLLIAPQGEDRILIQMPGVKPDEVQEVRTKLEQTAHLDFRLVHPQSAEKLAEMKATGTPVHGWVELPSKEHENDPDYPKSYLVSARSDLEGRYVSNAFPSYDAGGGNVIILDFDSEGADLFGKLTSANVGRLLAIVVDDVVLSAPRLNEPILNGRCEISGKFKQQEARSLATALENPLENPMEIIAENSVSPQFGAATIQQGKWTGIVATGIVALFMTLYYRLAGLIALVGLVVNILMVFGAMALFNFTLTMPGIAGIVLTVGMAVDANVLIYERLREETRAGKSLIASLESAFEKAFSAIFDANITTLMSAVILFYLASGLVKGFAITLTVGIVGTLFGALIVTRIFLHWFVDSGKLTKFNVTHIIPDRVFDMLGKARPFIIGSLVLAAVSVATFAVKGKDGVGIDFRGGAVTRFDLADDAKVTPNDVRDALNAAGIQGAYVQRNTSATGALLTVRTDFDHGEQAKRLIEEKFAGVKGGESERIGSVVGKELAIRSVAAYLLAVTCIFAYLIIFYELSFAVGAMVALFHDCLIAIGLSVLLGQQLSIIHIGAVLTIAGYSINDTIVVFDRIREMLRSRSGDIRDIMNEAISMTLSRTLLTSCTTLIPMFVLYTFGGPAMKDFSLPIIIGVIVGTYSTIFIASPVVMWWAKKTGKSLRRQVLDSDAKNIKPPVATA